MKKSFLLIIVMFIFAMISTACGDNNKDKDVADSPLVGEWYVPAEAHNGDVVGLIFDKNGTFTWYQIYTDSERTIESGTYIIKGDLVKMKCTQRSGMTGSTIWFELNEECTFKWNVIGNQLILIDTADNCEVDNFIRKK